MKRIYFFIAALCCMFSFLLPQKASAWICTDTYTQRINGVRYAYEECHYESVVARDDGDPFSPPATLSFQNYSHLTGTITLESSVKLGGKKRTIRSIHSEAFRNMKQANVNLILPNSIEKIGNYAFYDATGLLSIRMNEGLTELGERVFWGCTNLQSVTIPTTLTGIPSTTFAYCESLINIDIPSSVTVIGDNAFLSCHGLQSVNGGSLLWVQNIGTAAFAGCKNLQAIKFSAALVSIGERAFTNCPKLQVLALPANLQTIGEWAFSNTGLQTLTNYRATPQVINANVFYGVDLSKCILYVPKGCKEAYKNADVWKTFGYILEPGETPSEETPGGETPEEEPVETIATGTYQIGDLYYELHEDLSATLLARGSYQHLTGAMTVPASVTYGKYTYTVNAMNEYTFSNCSKLTSVALPNTITAIPEGAFNQCTALLYVTFSSALTSIGKKAFYGCTALDHIAWPVTLTEIGEQAFYACSNLIAVTIPGGVKVIPAACFWNCSKLSNVRLEEGITEIQAQAFMSTGIKTVTIPKSVTQIGLAAFGGCTNAISVRSLSETPPTANENAFLGIPKSCILYVPQGTKDAYAAATGWNYFTNIQEKGVNEKIKYGKLYYKLNENGTAYVTYETQDANNYQDLSGEITVEDKVIYQGFEYTVNEVGIDAFNGCKGITKVNLPLIMDEISIRSFKGCTNLAEVNIPSTLSFLMNSAFEETKLFNDNKDADGAVYYEGCLLYYPLNAITGTYSVKEGTRLIATDVFEFDEKITELILPEGLQCICNGSVTTMYALKTLHLPSTLYYIGGDFCNDCFYLTSIYNYSTNPVDLSDNYCFDNVNQSECTLYVPKGSRTAYENAEEWKEFPIFEMKGVYTVTFEDYNGFELKTEKVAEGENAHEPTSPEREGYTFTGWNKTFANVQSDLTVTAQYTRKQFTVRFLDGFNGNALIDGQQVEWGLSAEAPEAPVHDGYSFTGWDVEYDIVMDNLDVIARYAAGTTGIADITVDDKGATVKVLHNGQLYILRHGKAYNAQGAEVK